MGLLPQLSAAGGRKLCPPASFPYHHCKSALVFVLLAQTNLNHQPIQLTHAGENDQLKEAQFSPGLAIWTGLLCFIYNQHYRQCKGMVHSQEQEGESKTLSPESHIQLYQLRQNHSNRLLLLVILRHYYSTLYHNFPPFYLPEFSYQYKRKIWIRVTKRAGVLHLQ